MHRMAGNIMLKIFGRVFITPLYSPQEACAFRRAAQKLRTPRPVGDLFSIIFWASLFDVSLSVLEPKLASKTPWFGYSWLLFVASAVLPYLTFSHLGLSYLAHSGSSI